MVPGGLDVIASAYNVGDVGSIPGSGRSPGEGNGSPLQYACLENPMDGEACQATVHGVTELDTTEQLQFHFHFMITRTLCVMACETCISALTIKKENNAFKNQNEGTEIRNLKWSHMATMDVISNAFLNH